MQKFSPGARSTRGGRSGRDKTTRTPKIPDERRFRVPPSLSMPKRVFLCCRCCGYDPPTVPDNGACPKCGGHSWQRYALSRRLVPEGQQ